MQKDSALYDFTQTLQGQIFYAAFRTNLSDEQRQEWSNRDPIMNIKRGYAESPNWVFVQALEFAPDPLTVERFRRRAVYSSPSLTLALLELLASEKYFDPIDNEYHLTEKGLDEAEKIRQFRFNVFDGFAPISPDISAKIEGYMKRIILASLEADTISTRSLIHSRKRAPQSDAPPLAKIVQYGSDFNAFRDDAHMAAYGEYDVEGHIWEALSYITSQQARSARDLYEKLAYRGFYTQDWQTALDTLVHRNWLKETDGNYQATEKALQISQEIEAKTDAYFYAPWAVLSDDEYVDLTVNMQKLSEACQALTR